jgi:hypothetical protein
MDKNLPYDVLLPMCESMNYVTLIRMEYISKYYYTFIRSNPQLFHWKMPTQIRFRLRDLIYDVKQFYIVDNIFHQKIKVSLI